MRIALLLDNWMFHYHNKRRIRADVMPALNVKTSLKLIIAMLGTEKYTVIYVTNFIRNKREICKSWFLLLTDLINDE
jgi:hypothetical protein